MNSPAYHWNKRRDKRHERKQVSPVQVAYYEGMDAADWRGQNRYPPGIRHDEWERGFKVASDMEHHRINDTNANRRARRG